MWLSLPLMVTVVPPGYTVPDEHLGEGLDVVLGSRAFDLCLLGVPGMVVVVD